MYISIYTDIDLQKGGNYNYFNYIKSYNTFIKTYIDIEVELV